MLVLALQAKFMSCLHFFYTRFIPVSGDMHLFLASISDFVGHTVHLDLLNVAGVDYGTMGEELLH